MEDYKKEFIKFLLNNNALRFGEFTLKSGRKSPYFINTGMFCDGKSVAKLCNFYAAHIVKVLGAEKVDVLFGPAYKGIPLCVATSISLATSFGINKPYAFDRKEAKGHGECSNRKKMIVGHELKNGEKVLILDDVFTTGQTKIDTAELLKDIADVKFAGVLIAVDRMERGNDNENAIKEFEEQTGIRVYSIISVKDIIYYLEKHKKTEEAEKIKKYLEKYGV
ncbi:orotate phosphoribosyltransferase [Candidatus Woesearchaeota archaeon]|nr:MAG: orotate phosphoribosyltransferase [Candidatus Woesearchaeota archaeon]